jgi:hypothetical protein
LPAIRLAPLLVDGRLGRRFTAASPELSVRAELLEKGDIEVWEAFIAELRHLHLGQERPKRSVIGELTDA